MASFQEQPGNDTAAYGRLIGKGVKTEIVSQMIRCGKQHWRLNPDGSWSVLAFGSFGPEDRGLRYGWITVEGNKVPDEVRQAVR